MKQYSMHLQPVFFNLVKSGEKTIELRAWDEKRRQIVPGDEIVFRTDGTDETITVHVTHLVVTRDFESLFKSASRSSSYPGLPKSANIFFLYASTPG